MKKTHPPRLYCVLLAVFALVLSSSVAMAWSDLSTELLPPPPKANQILAKALGESPMLPGTDEIRAEVLAEADETPFIWPGATVVYENSVGIGSFVPDSEQRRPAWDMLWSLRARLHLFWRKVTVQARIDLFQPVVANADATTTRNKQFTISDTILSIMAPSFYTEPVTKIRFGAWTDLLFPSSLQSRHAGLKTGWRLGAIVARAFGPVDVMYRFRFTKNFHGQASPKLRYRYLPGFDNYPAEGVNTDFGFLNQLSVIYSFLDDFYALADFAIINNFHYDATGDISCADVGLAAGCDLSSPYARDERGRVDMSALSFEVGYRPWRHITLALGVSTAQPPRTSDNTGFRWPLNFSEASANYTRMYFHVIGSY